MDPNQFHFLQMQGFPSGMIQALISQKHAFPLRVWILDNSIYMGSKDAHIFRGNHQIVDATRWEELQDCVAYHSQFAATFAIPVRFALVNDPHIAGVPQYFSLNQTGNLALEQLTLKHVMTCTKPSGPNLLTKQLNVLRDYIASVASRLRENNQTVSVILATQGLPTDEAMDCPHNVLQDFLRALSSFESLPVCFVVRLCTDDEKAFEFFNSIDMKLANLDIDVLDDWTGEAVEVYLRNPWLTYGIALHRYREMGFRFRVIDAIDERALTPNEIRDLSYLLFGDHQYPDPVHDWNGFLRVVSDAMGSEQVQWNPVTKSAAPWLNLSLLNTLYCPRASPAAPVPLPRTPASAGERPSCASMPINVPQQRTAPAVQSMQSSSSSPSRIHDSAKLREHLSTKWAKLPPRYDSTRSIEELLGGIDSTFVLVEPHEYFQDKFHPFSKHALSSGDEVVLKRAVRKMKFFLHPDKLPKTFNENQNVLCRTLWDVTSEAWEAHQKK